MLRQDPVALDWVRFECPHVTLEGPAEHDPVLSRHHVVVTRADREVIDLGLRQEHGELPLDRDELLVTKERTVAETRAVDYEELVRCRHGTGSRQGAYDGRAAGQ